MLRVICGSLAFVAALASASATADADLVPSSSLLMGVSYDRAVDGDIGLDNEIWGGFRGRHMFGRKLAWCTGFDGAIGAGIADTGFLYETELYPAGVAFGIQDDGFVSVCGGAGLSGATGTIPFALQFPLELAAELQFGSVRTIAWARTRWIAGEDARQDGSDLISFADEFDAMLGLRFGRNSRYWERVTAGQGAFVGLNYRERAGARFAGIVVGVALWGGRR